MIQVARLLVVDCEADVDVRNKVGKTALHCAVESGNADIVRLLALESAAAVNELDESSSSPLHLACRRGAGEVIRILLQREDIETCGLDRWGRSPLQYCCRHTDMDLAIVQELLDSGAEADQAAECDGMTAVHHASAAGSARILSCLLSHSASALGASLTCDRHGYNAFHHAIFNGKYSATALLLLWVTLTYLHMFFSGQLLGLFCTMLCITALCGILLAILLA